MDTYTLVEMKVHRGVEIKITGTKLGTKDERFKAHWYINERSFSTQNEGYTLTKESAFLGARNSIDKSLSMNTSVVPYEVSTAELIQIVSFRECAEQVKGEFRVMQGLAIGELNRRIRIDSKGRNEDATQ
jgi:hypothetical protein